MTTADPIEALRARVATLGPQQREALRLQLEERGIAWERVAPAPVSGPVAPAQPDRLPLSPAQLHFWVQQHIQPETSAFHIAFAWRISGPLDVHALERALQHVVDRHEPLRTAFPIDNGEPSARVQAHCPITLAQTDLSTAPERYQSLAQSAVNAPFDLARAPLIRAHLFRLGAAEHALAIAIHHIVADGWSRGVFMRELAACYRGYATGGEPALPPLPRRFGDVVLAQQEWLAGPECQRQKAWWQELLAGLEPQELPTDRPRAGNTSAASETITASLSPASAAHLRTLASRLGATSFMVLLATFKLLIHRYTGHRDLALCVPMAGRSQEDAAGMIGLFVNTLVLRTALEPHLSFREWLARVREGFADAYQHQDFPFPRLVDALGLNRDAGHSSLFQVIFQVQTEGYRHQNAEVIDLGVPGLHVTQGLLPLADAKADLTWHMMEREDGVSLALEYRTAVFDAARLERMIVHFEALLEAVAEAPNAPLPALDYIPADEQAALIARGAPAPTPLPAIGVHEAISQTAARYPDAPALEWAGRAWSYAELDAAADAMARHLLARPELAEPGARVAVCLPRCADMVIAFLAILKAGATYVPLDPKHPADRLGYILEDADAALVITDNTTDFGDRPCLDPAQLRAPAPDIALPPSLPNRLAYLIYTSGSTGRPKGALIEHAGLLNHLRAFAREPGLSAGDRFLAVTTVGFDISILEMLLPLIVGATAVLADQEILMSPAELARVLEEGRITHMQATPASWRMLLDAGWERRPGMVALVGGEALDGQLAQRLLARTATLWNLYGPTETTIWASALRVAPHHLGSAKVPIAGPSENTQFHILDAYMQPVPDGVPGELCIGGVGLGQGYWRRQELTAEKFVPNPFSAPENPSLRLYRTGDVVIRRPDGAIDFVGRTDFQIKLRGYRIEVGEIESLLQEEPAVAHAVVLLDEAHERLVAYCRLEEPMDADARAALERELRRSLAERLPRYMVPGAFVLMDAFPLNTNGKVDRKRLPAPDAPQTASGQTAPRNRLEATLLAVWKEVLRREDIGVEDNFFDLGGDSVIAIQIIARARGRGLAIDPLQMFEHQTVAAQARIARPGARAASLPLSVWQRHTTQRTAAEPWLVTLAVPELPADAMQQAIAAAATHHPVLSLRLGSGWEGGADVPPLATDVGGQDAALKHWAAALATPGDGPLWQVAAYPSPNGARLAIAAHPLLLDATSVTWLASDLRETLQRLAAGATPALPATGDYGAWLGEDASPARASATPAPAPVEAVLQTALDAGATQTLLTTARHLETSAELLVLTAFAETLQESSAADAVALDLLTCNRIGTAPGSHRTLGNFTRLAPLSLRLGGGALAERLASATSALASAGGQGLALSNPPAADAALSWHDTSATELEWLSAPRPELPAGYPIALRAELSAGGLALAWRFDTGRLPHAAAERLAGRLLDALAAMRADGASSAAKVDRLLARLKQRKD